MESKCIMPENCTFWFCHHHKKCLLHEHVEKNNTPVKSKPTLSQIARNNVRKTKVISFKDKPTQPTPITIDNFFIRTKGVFREIKEVPYGYKSIFKSKKSEYFTNEEKTKIVRISDHWGFKIRFCAWHLQSNPEGSYEKMSSFKWSRINGKKCFKIGIIHISDLSVNNS